MRSPNFIRRRVKPRTGSARRHVAQEQYRLMPGVQEADLVGKIHDISDVLVLTNAAEMPFTTMIKKGKKPENTLVEYPIDKYDSANSTGVLFGQDAGNFVNTQANRGLLYARVMRQWRNPMVDTAAQEISKQAGDGGDKFAQSRAKTTVELKQDMELTLLGAQDSTPESGTTPAVTRGMRCWTNYTLQTTDTATLVPAAFRPASGQIYSGTLADFWEADLKAILQARYETLKARGDLQAFAGTDIKSRVSDFTRFDVVPSGKTLARRFDGKITEIVNMVEVYRGDWGTVTFTPDLFTYNSKACEIVDMNMVEVRPVTAPRFIELENKGGGRRGINEVMYALVNRNPQAHGSVQAT